MIQRAHQIKNTIYSYFRLKIEKIIFQLKKISDIILEYIKVCYNWLLNKIKTIIDKTTKIISKLLNWVFKHYLSINVFYACLLIIFIFITKDTASDLDTGTLKEIHLVFLKYAVYLGVASFMIQAISMLMFEIKVNKYKNNLNSEGFNKFIEYEYKKSDQTVFSGLAYIFSICIGILAIYLSITSMALSVDLGQSNNGELNIQGTEYLLTILAEWLGIFIIIFPIYFMGFKFNKITKRNYLEDAYYGEYKI